MNRGLVKLLITLSLLTPCLTVSARQPYHATVTVDDVSAHVSAPNILDLKNDLKTTSLEVLLPIYTPVSPVSLGINLRGIGVAASFAANSTTLEVQIPQAGITASFTGGTRDDSLSLFEDFIHDAAPGNKSRLLKAYARYSPIDPIAGNPNSLMAQMAQSDYLLGHLSPLSGCDCGWSSQPIVHQFQAGTYVNRAFSRGFDTTLVTLPLRYSYSPNLDWALIIDAPLTYLRNGGASSVIGSIGAGLRLPITHEWSLTPIIRGGFGGTLDLCTAGSFISTGLTSVYNYKIWDYVLSMTNYAGYFSTTNLWLTGLNFNYHLHNYIFKNGLSLTSCEGFCLYGRPVNFSVSFEDSYFAREHLYLKHFDEVGFSLITTYLNPCICYDCLSLGFFYQFGEKQYRGYCFKADYQF